ncbi:MAG TPA: flagellar hook-associated protein FlgL [candidate division Zixibacteria bacterium]|nr:flagellar hook-associated protein FlgL [candidate division Zixibacteria bacterium]
MRVTHQMLSAQVIDSLQSAYRRLAAAQEAAASGRRINRLSDDPLGAARALSVRAVERSLEQYEKNLDTAMPLLEQADSILEAVGDRLVRAKELALAMANVTNSSEQRLAAAMEVREILNQLLSLANTKIEGRFIFAGFANGAPPFVSSGVAVSYAGDAGEIMVPVSADRSLALNVPGDRIFQGAGSASGVDIFDVYLDLESALQNNDTDGADGIRAQLGRLDAAIEQILRFRAEIGARLNSAQAAKDAAALMKLQWRERRSEIEDADAVAAYSDFARYQAAFQAALQSAARTLQPSLLEFLR